MQQPQNQQQNSPEAQPKPKLPTKHHNWPSKTQTSITSKLQNNKIIQTINQTNKQQSKSKQNIYNQPT